MINGRQNFRLRKQFDVAWSIPGQRAEGTGVIFNISLSGMLFVTDKLFEPEHGLMMSFKVAQANPFPANGKLVWFRKVGPRDSQYQCGARFPSEAISNPAWAQWLEDNISKLADTADNKILEHFLNEGQSDD